MKNYIAVIIFVIFFISIISIIAIFIARGYNFTGKELSQSGILEITSNPQGAKILVNGEEKASTPKKIELNSGEYEIQLQKDSYTSWKKKVVVEASITTQIQALLIPKKKNVEQITFNAIKNAYFSENGEIALYITNSQTNPAIWMTKLEKNIFDLSQSQSSKIANLKEILVLCPDIHNPLVEISQDLTKAILTCKQEDTAHFFLLELRQPESNILHINQQIGFNPKIARFSYNSNQLIIQTEDFLALFDKNTKELTLLSTIEKGYEPQISVSKDSILLLSYTYDHSERQLIRISGNMQKENITLDDTSFEETQTISSPRMKAEYLGLSTNTSSTIYEFYPQTKQKRIFSKKKISFIEWSPDGLSFLFKEEYSLKSGLVTIYPDGTMKVTVYTLLESFNPKNHFLKWSPNSGNVLFYDKKLQKVFILDSDGKNKTQIYSGKISSSQAFQLSKNETFLILLLKDDQESSNLYSIKLRV